MIKNLLFDLGGVIIDIKKENCIQAFTKLGLENASSYFGDYAQDGIFMAIEDGSIGVDEFHAALHDVMPENVTDAQIDDAFERFIVGIPRHRLETLRALRREGYKIYLLSNTNPVMWKGIIRSEFQQEGLCREDYFDGIVTSFEAHSAKPDHSIFHYTTETLGINPAETLFFDDSILNVEAARACGYNAVHVAAGTEFTQYLPEK